MIDEQLSQDLDAVEAVKKALNAANQPYAYECLRLRQEAVARSYARDVVRDQPPITTTEGR